MADYPATLREAQLYAKAMGATARDVDALATAWMHHLDRASTPAFVHATQNPRAFFQGMLDSLADGESNAADPLRRAGAERVRPEGA